MSKPLTTPFGTFRLYRSLEQGNQNHQGRAATLQAWDAADEFLLQTLSEPDRALPSSPRILLLNDRFGVLTVGLSRLLAGQGAVLINQSDSWLAQAITRQNLTANRMAAESVQFIDSLTQPEGVFDLLLLRIPKNLGLLEDQLTRLRPCLKPDTRIIATGMIRNTPPTAWKVMDRIIGPTVPSKGWKKARMLFVRPEDRPEPPSPYPVCWPLPDIEGRDWPNIELINHANVFSRDKLDLGTRLFLEHLPNPAEFPRPARDIIDLGCGNGVLGTLMAMNSADSRVRFVDESFMALASARATFMNAGGEASRAEFLAGDGLQQIDRHSADLILCNPPFHQDHVVGTHTAESMFAEAARVLRTDGQLWVVGNRHLGYHKTLGHHFLELDTVASNAKFVVLNARSPRQRQ